MQAQRLVLRVATSDAACGNPAGDPQDPHSLTECDARAQCGGMTASEGEHPLRLTSSLAAEGLDAVDIQRLLAARELTRVRRGVYAEPADLNERASHVRLARATMNFVHPDGVMSHMTAAALHELPVRFEELGHVHMTRQGPGHGRRGNILWLRNSTIADADRTVVDGLPVTSLERTACDLARSLPYEWGVIVMDAALRAGADRVLLLEQVERARRWRGSRRARQVLEFADPRSGSPTESLSRVQMERLGLPRPVLQQPIWLDGRIVAESDFGWPDLHTVGEADGKAKYGELLKQGQGPADAIMAEKRREESIRQAGWWLTRWGWLEASNRVMLGNLLRRAFANALNAA